MMTQLLTNPRYRYRCVSCLTLLSAVLLLPGCGDEQVAKLDDYLEELEFERPLESVREIKLNTDGPFRFPCATRYFDTTGSDVPPKWVQMKFDLYLITAEEDRLAVLASIKQHRGMLNDTVMTVCRGSSIEQLQDNRWAALKSRLLVAIRPLLGGERIRQISLVYSAPWEPI